MKSMYGRSAIVLAMLALVACAPGNLRTVEPVAVAPPVVCKEGRIGSKIKYPCNPSAANVQRDVVREQARPRGIGAPL